jgi:hypothetical protein
VAARMKSRPVEALAVADNFQHLPFPRTSGWWRDACGARGQRPVRASEQASNPRQQFPQAIAQVVLVGVTCGQKRIANKNRIGPGEEAQRLHLIGHCGPSRRQTNLGHRHQDSGQCNGANKGNWIDRFGLCEGRSFDRGVLRRSALPTWNRSVREPKVTVIWKSFNESQTVYEAA